MVSLFFLPKVPAAGSKPSSQDLPGSGVSCKNCGPSPAPAPSSELWLQKDLVRRRRRGSVFEYFGNCRCRRGQGDQRHEIRQDITTDKLLRHPNVVCLHERCRLQNVKHGKLLPLFGSEVFNSSFVSAPAEPTAGSFSRSYAEAMSTARGDRSSLAVSHSHGRCSSTRNRGLVMDPTPS